MQVYISQAKLNALIKSIGIALRYGSALLLLSNSVAAQWQPLSADSVHDPSAPTLDLLQSPEEALSVLPPDGSGNRVNWVDALRQEFINPRTNIFPETKIELLDLDIYFDQTATLGVVRFPHRAHTEWLDCANCHDQIFKKGRGVNEFGMYSILEGEFCGQCHGAVAFPLTECNRCHSVSRDEYETLKKAAAPQ